MNFDAKINIVFPLFKQRLGMPFIERPLYCIVGSFYFGTKVVKVISLYFSFKGNLSHSLNLKSCDRWKTSMTSKQKISSLKAMTLIPPLKWKWLYDTFRVFVSLILLLSVVNSCICAKLVNSNSCFFLAV